MQEQDMQQIKNTVKETIKEDVREVVKEEIKGVEEKITGVEGGLKKVEERITGVGEKVDEVLRTSKEQFDENTMKLEEIKAEVQKRPTKDEFSNWRNEQVEPIERDVEKLKYLHREKWKDLPDSGEVSRVLAEEGMK